MSTRENIRLIARTPLNSCVIFSVSDQSYHGFFAHIND